MRDCGTTAQPYCQVARTAEPDQLDEQRAKILDNEEPGVPRDVTCWTCGYLADDYGYAYMHTEYVADEGYDLHDFVEGDRPTGAATICNAHAFDADGSVIPPSSDASGKDNACWHLIIWYQHSEADEEPYSSIEVTGTVQQCAQYLADHYPDHALDRG